NLPRQSFPSPGETSPTTSLPTTSTGRGGWMRCSPWPACGRSNPCFVQGRHLEPKPRAYRLPTAGIDCTRPRRRPRPLASASLGAGGLPLATHPPPVAGPEDEKKGEEG